MEINAKNTICLRSLLDRNVNTIVQLSLQLLADFIVT